MTEVEPKTRHPLRKFTIVALSVNIMAAATSWWAIIGVILWQDQDNNVVGYWAVVSIPVAIVATIVGIVLDIFAGMNRGANRAIGIVGGLILLSPVLYSIVTTIVYGG